MPEVRRMRFIVVAICAVGLFFPMYWLFEAVVGPDWGAGIAAVAMYIAFPIVALKAWPTKESPGSHSMEGALTDGTLESADFEVNEVVQIQEYEDAGLHFLLDIGSGKTLFLSGQYLYSAVDAGRFPSNRIRVYWNAAHGITYGVQSLGDRILPSQMVPPPAQEVVDDGVLPSDRDVIGQSIQDVLQALSRNA